MPGYSKHAVLDVEDKYLCTLCVLILKHPKHGQCGHRFCASCIDEFLSANGQLICPVCIREDPACSLCRILVFDDLVIRQEMENLAAKCINVGCEWTGIFSSYMVHEGNCEYRLIECPWEGCFVHLRGKDFYAHQEQHRRIEPVLCHHCNGPCIMNNGEGDHHTYILGVQNVKYGDGSQSEVREYNSSIFNLSRLLDAFEMLLAIYEEIIAILNQRVEQLAEQIMELIRMRNEDRVRLESLEKMIKAQDKVIALKDVRLAEQDLRIQHLEQTSYDGTLTWKISDFAQKRSDAVSGQTLSLYSPVFYTSKSGYKMCARVYLNGDGMGKGNHVSLFFILMKGEYDAILRWPFAQKVTLMWIDQNQKKDMVYSFHPDPNSRSSKRPTSEENIASGFPEFMPLSLIDSTTSGSAYVKDDVAFLRIKVDTDSL